MKANSYTIGILADIIQQCKLLNEEELTRITNLASTDFSFAAQLAIADSVQAVKCCHMQMKEKYWVYAGTHINYEFAFGPLVIHEQGFGIDLRPANPFNNRHRKKIARVVLTHNQRKQKYLQINITDHENCRKYSCRSTIHYDR